jgi:hypothetical protein
MPKTELEKTQEALNVATDFIHKYACQVEPALHWSEATTKLSDIKSILAPDPIETEDVTESAGWVNIYSTSNPTSLTKTIVTNAYATKELADQNATFNRISCQELFITITREKKQPVVKTWTLENASLIEDKDGSGICRWIRLAPFTDDVPTGKTGTLVYTYPEDF